MFSWYSSPGQSLFQFGFSDSLSDISSAGTLTITDWTFQHFFHDFGSLISPIKSHGHIVINGSTFTKFSNCGSIIGDSVNYPSLGYLEVAFEYENTYRSSMFTANLLKNKLQIEPSSVCKSATWGSINIQSSTFTNFNYMKSEISVVKYVQTETNMLYQGLILSLVDYMGSVLIKDNTFNDLKFKFANCELLNDPSEARYDTNTIWKFEDVTTGFQMKALLIIDIKSEKIEIAGNTFTENNSEMGLIYIHRKSTFNGLVLIHGNIFAWNSALFGTNVLKVHLFTDALFEDEFTRSNMVCAGVQISSNTFVQNIGWLKTAGVMHAMWYQDNDFSLNFIEYHHNPDIIMSNIVSNNYSKQGVLEFATETPVEFPGTSVTIDAEKFMLKDNTYNENYAGAEAAIVSVQGFRRVHMSGDTYIGNGGTYLEALNYLGNIPATGEADLVNNYTPQAWKLGAYYITNGDPNTIAETVKTDILYKQYPIGPLKIGSSFYVHATGLTFDNNAFPVTAPTSTYVPRHTSAILFESIQGEIHLNSLTIQK